MPSIALFDLLARGAAAGLFAHLALAVAIRAPGGPMSGRLAAASFNVGLACYLLASSPDVFAAAGPAAYAMSAVALFNPILLCWTALEIFEDGFRPRAAHVAACVVVVGLGIATLYWPPAGIARQLVVAALYLWLLAVVARDARADLVDARRKLRFAMFSVAILAALGVTAAEAGVLAGTSEQALRLAQSILFLALGLGFSLWLASQNGDAWFIAAARGSGAIEPLSVADRVVSERLDRLMAAGVWREEGLTIGRLAVQAKTQEHRLRRIINQSKGHRNFNAFLNAARIEEARRMLADPVQADRRISEIAFELGFSSLGPFNRAFRDATGTSPTVFREEALKRAR